MLQPLLSRCPDVLSVCANYSNTGLEIPVMLWTSKERVCSAQEPLWQEKPATTAPPATQSQIMATAPPATSPIVVSPASSAWNSMKFECTLHTSALFGTLFVLGVTTPFGLCHAQPVARKIMHRKCKQCKIHVKQNGLTTRLVRRPQGCNWYTYPAFRLNDALRASRLLMLSFAGCWTAKTSSKGNGYRLIMVAWVQCGDQWGC